MVASEVHLIRENERELYFAHRPLSGVVFMVIGLGVVYFFSTSPRVTETFARWIFGAGGSLFALFGFGAALWRYELRLDLVNRAYHGRRGFWPNPKTIHGSLDELEGVVLTSRIDRSDKNRQIVWSVSLAFRTWPKPVVVMESQNEVKAHEALEHYAKKLRIPALDRTGGQEQAQAWTELDLPLRDQSGHPEFIPPLPAGSRIEFLDRPGRRTITLPAAGPSFAGFFLILFGTPFFGGGSFFLWMILFLPPERVQGPQWVGWLISTIFIVIGGFIMFLGVAGMWGRPVIEEGPEDVTHTLLLFGRRVRSQWITKRDVEEVLVREDENKRPELVLRSNKKVLRIRGLQQSPQELEWLRVAVSVFVSR